MPQLLGDVAPKNTGGGKKHPDTVTKIKLSPKNGTARGKFVDFWFYDVNEKGFFAKKGEAVAGKKVRIAFQLQKRPDVLLEKRMKVWLGERSAFSLFIAAFTGLEPGSEEMKAFDIDELLNVEAFAQYEFKQKEDAGYTDIKAFFPLEESDAKPEPTAKAEPEPQPAQDRRKSGEIDPNGPAMVAQLNTLKSLIDVAKNQIGWNDAKTRGGCRVVTEETRGAGNGITDIEQLRFGEAQTMINKINVALGSTRRKGTGYTK